MSSLDEPARKAHVAGINANLRLACDAAQALGDVPPVLAAPGLLQHGPDERSIIIFVAFLCARVLEVSKEDRAAQRLQHCFRHRRSWQPGEKVACKALQAVRLWLVSEMLKCRGGNPLCWHFTESIVCMCVQSQRRLDENRPVHHLCQANSSLGDMVCLCAGQARACLQRWIAAAKTVQRAVRVWQFRYRLLKGRSVRQALQAAVLQLQAMWRARRPFRSYQALRNAAVCTQVCVCSLFTSLARSKRINCQSCCLPPKHVYTCSQ